MSNPGLRRELWPQLEANTWTERVQWAPRVSPFKIRQLYESDARGLLDEDLLDEVDFGIYVRCQDMLDIAEAQRGRVKCRNCGNIIVRRLTDQEQVGCPNSL